MKPYLLGLTGSIGSGKTTTAEVFRALGVPVWSADEAVHRLYETDKKTIDAIGRIVPEAIAGGCVHRGALREALQKTPALFAKLEAIVHPRLKALRQEFIKDDKLKGEGCANNLKLFDIPLLYETGAEAWLDGVLVVVMERSERARRVLARGTMDRAGFDMIESRQMPQEEKQARADFVIRTDSPESVQREVKQLLENLKKRDA